MATPTQPCTMPRTTFRTAFRPTFRTTSRTAGRPRRLTAARSCTALVLVGATAFATLPIAPSSADPRPSIAQVQQKVDALNAQVDVVIEEYANSKIALADATRKAAVAQSRVRASQAQLDLVKVSMSSMAAAAYRNGGTDEFVSLINTATPQTFLDRAGALDRIAAGQSAQLAAAATARHRLQTVQRDAVAARSAQDAVARTMSLQKAHIEGVLAQEQRLLGSLKAEEQARLAAARTAALARAAEAARAAARASRSRAASSASSSNAPAPSYNGPASGRAAIAVQEAYRQLGKPYVWGGSGPNSFDCSGLTAWVWAKAGVSLSHSAQAQFGEGQHVSQSQIQPGDLTFYGSPIHHDGIYIGGGQMISAPHTGDVVKIQAAFRSDYVGASRP